jgi:hypothetical protein
MPHHKHARPPVGTPSFHVNLRLERWHRRCLYASFALLALSGAAWLAARFFLRHAGPFGETVHPIEPWAMKVHGGAAMLVLFFLGSLMNSHIRRALKSRRNRVTGWIMLSGFSLLVGTGFGLYYVAGEGDRPLWSILHWVLGLAMVAGSAAHVAVGRAERRRHLQ